MSDTDTGTSTRGRRGKGKGTGAGRPEGSKNSTPDTSAVNVTDIESGAALAMAELIKASTPVGTRSPQQLAMDEKAEKAYAAWVSDGRPSAWKNIPVVTYFIQPEQVDAYRYLIRRAADAVEVQQRTDGTVIPGARAMFGQPFTLVPEMAEKIGRPDDAGKVVLAWAIVDKRAKKADETTTASVEAPERDGTDDDSNDGGQDDGGQDDGGQDDGSNGGNAGE